MYASSAPSLLQVGSAWSTSAPSIRHTPSSAPSVRQAASSAPCRHLTSSSAASPSLVLTRPRQLAAQNAVQRRHISTSRRHISTSRSNWPSLQARSVHDLAGLPPVTSDSHSHSPRPAGPPHTNPNLATLNPQALPSPSLPRSSRAPVQLNGPATGREEATQGAERESSVRGTGSPGLREAAARAPVQRSGPATGMEATRGAERESSVQGTGSPGTREVAQMLSLVRLLVAAGLVAVGVALCGPRRAWAKDKGAAAAATAVLPTAVESVNKGGGGGADGVADGVKPSSRGGPAEKAEAGKTLKDPEKHDVLALTLRKHLERHPTDVSAMRHLLQLRMLRGDMPAAIEVLDKLVEQEPSALEWQFLRAQAQEVAGRLEEAREGFQAILVKEPFSARALQGLSVVMLKSGEEGEVMELLKLVTEKAQKEEKKQEVIDIKLLVAQVLMRQGNFEAALGQYRAVGAEDPSDFRPPLCEGLVHAMLGDAEAAEESFVRFRKMCPDDFPNRGYLDEMMLKAKVEARRLALQGKQGERKAARGGPADGAMQQPGRQPVEVVAEGQKGE